MAAAPKCTGRLNYLRRPCLKFRSFASKLRLEKARSCWQLSAERWRCSNGGGVVADASAGGTELELQLVMW